VTRADDDRACGDRGRRQPEARSLVVLDGGAGHRPVEWGGTAPAAGAGAERGGRRGAAVLHT
jgi:hypothetical protein